MANGVNSSNFMYASSQKPATTPGGYGSSASRTEQRASGLYKFQIPLKQPLSIPMSEINAGMKRAKYTYRNYSVPEFDGAELVGQPAGSFPMINGGYGYENIRGQGNTVEELNRVQTWSTEEMRGLQVAAVKKGWLPKSVADGRPNRRTMGLVAFLMDQGNQTGYNWQDILQEGPKWLRKIGGADVVNASATDQKSGYDGPVTSVQKSVSYSTKATARGLLTDALANVLGRGPKDDEVDEFLDLLRSKQKANPTVSTNVSDSNEAGSMRTQDSTTDEGFGQDDAVRLAERFATRTDPAQASRYKRAGYEQLLDQLIMGG